MTQRANILNELKELDSLLATASSSTLYQVPAGYFDGLATDILNRIKSLEFIESISRTTPYVVPSGYFDGLEKKLMAGVLQSENPLSATEELESLSPLLSGLTKEMPYSVPENYFDTLKKIDKEEKPKAKVITMGPRKWLRYAAAAVVTGVIAIGALLFFQKDNISPVNKSYAWVKKSLNQVSTDDLDQFIDLSNEQLPVIASITPGAEVKDLVNNLSDDELRVFLDDVKDSDPGIDLDDDILLN
jgi:hypothetical protein